MQQQTENRENLDTSNRDNTQLPNESNRFGTVREYFHPNRNIVTIACDRTLKHALDVMKSKNISSMPVKRIFHSGGEAEGGRSQGQVIGLIDNAQILSYIAFFCGSVTKGDREAMEAKLTITVEELISMVLEEEGKRVWAYDYCTPVTKIIEHMSKGVHRCLITQEGNQVYNILSQRDIVAFALKHLDKIHYNLLESTIQSLGMVNPKERKVGHFAVSEPYLVSASKDSLLVDCFKQMEREEVLAVPLLDEDGALFGTLSASDLRGINADDLSESLFQPAYKFISNQKKAVVAPPSITFIDLLDLIDSNHVHRVWIINEENKPVGVVSLTDIMAKLVS